MTMDELEKLKPIVAKDLKITEATVLSISLDVPILYHKYLDIFTVQFKLMKDKDNAMKELYGKLYDKYRFQGDKQLDTKGEVETYVFSDAAYVKLQYEYNVQVTVVKYLESVLEAIGRITYTVGNFIKYREFLVGK
jgi:hypothetical protein